MSKGEVRMKNEEGGGLHLIKSRPAFSFIFSLQLRMKRTHTRGSELAE